MTSKTLTSPLVEQEITSPGTYRKWKRRFKGSLKFHGVYFIPFIGDVYRVSTWNGHHFLVDKSGNVYSAAIEDGIEFWDPARDVPTSKSEVRGYGKGLDGLVDWSVWGKGGSAYPHV